MTAITGPSLFLGNIYSLDKCPLKASELKAWTPANGVPGELGNL